MMKLMCTFLGILIVLLGIMLSPWPRFISGVASNFVMSIPEADDDLVFQNIIKVLTAVVAYVLVPVCGGLLGFLVGYIVERKLD